LAPDQLPPPILSFDNVTAGYDGKSVLKKLNLRLDGDDRIALLGANGEGKSTLSRLLADRLMPMSGTIHRASKLRVGFFAQHQLEELVQGQSAFQHLQRLRPQESPTQLRTRLAAAGISNDIADNMVEYLSGGQKARLLLAIAAIDVPHVLILDEPTNHLDIESREALAHALNAYEGCIILVSHDAHLVDLVANRLWLVENGCVSIFDGDMADYRKWLLSQRVAFKAASYLKSNCTVSSSDKKHRSGRQRRQSASVLRSKIRTCEKQLETLAAQKQLIETEMTMPGFFDQSNKESVATLNSRLVRIDAKISAVEDAWLEYQEELEQFTSKSAL